MHCIFSVLCFLYLLYFFYSLCFSSLLCVLLVFIFLITPHVFVSLYILDKYNLGSEVYVYSVYQLGFRLLTLI